MADSGVADALVWFEGRDVTRAELDRVRHFEMLDRLVALAEQGGGAIDPDTIMSAGLWVAARRAAGMGLAATDASQARWVVRGL